MGQGLDFFRAMSTLCKELVKLYKPFLPGEGRSMEKKERKKLDLEGLNVETLVANSVKAAISFGLIEQGGQAYLGYNSASGRVDSGKRVFREESVFISQ
jgi:hypothetical protein